MVYRTFFLLVLVAATTALYSEKAKNDVAETVEKATEKNRTSSPWVDKFVATDGIRIHYIAKNISKGNRIKGKPTLLFIPGLSMPAWIWEKQLSHFSDSYTVVAMDPRSQGDSTKTSEGMFVDRRARDIKAVVSELNLEPVVLIGWSCAVTEIASYVEQFGTDGLAGIVFVDGGVAYTPEAIGPAAAKSMDEYWKLFPKCRITKTCSFVKELFKQPQNDEYVERLTRTALRMPTSSIMALFLDSKTKDYRHVLSTITKPTLIVTIDSSWLPVVQEMQKLTPNSRLEVVPGAGHALFVDQPELFNKLLDEFLDHPSFRK